MSEAGVIHDIGYQRYTGPRLGRAAVFGALYPQNRIEEKPDNLLSGFS